jgi:acylpyruvate hydrolase
MPITVELGVVIGKTAKDVREKDADAYIAGYSELRCMFLFYGELKVGVALAVDMTARNVQDEVKKKGLPWSTAKGFDTFTPIG